jgi:hypothetical protein
MGVGGADALRERCSRPGTPTTSSPELKDGKLMSCEAESVLDGLKGAGATVLDGLIGGGAIFLFSHWDDIDALEPWPAPFNLASAAVRKSVRLRSSVGLSSREKLPLCDGLSH